MRNILLVALVSTTVGVVGLEKAVAGMGDPSRVLKEKNAICEMQRRGEGPLYPNLCLPELPLAPVYEDRPRQR